MQGTSVLFGEVIAVLCIVIAGVWGATQWTAAALGYQLRLGSPWFDLFGTPVYHSRQFTLNTTKRHRAFHPRSNPALLWRAAGSAFRPRRQLAAVASLCRSENGRCSMVAYCCRRARARSSGEPPRFRGGSPSCGWPT